MRASRIGDTAEASEAIADDGAGGIEAAPGQLFHLLAPEAVNRRGFRRTGWPSGVVSMATMIGVLPGAPRPRSTPERSPPR